MEETSGAVIKAPFGEAPFGELISEWLEEGDRLSASAADVVAPSPATESRLRQVLQRFQPVLARHRLLVLAGIGLLPLALILGTHRGAPAQPAAAMVAVAPVAAPAVAEFRPAASAPAQTVLALASASTATVTPVPPALGIAGPAEPTAAPARHHHHHHHHHHATSPPAVASAARAARR